MQMINSGAAQNHTLTYIEAAQIVQSKFNVKKHRTDAIFEQGVAARDRWSCGLGLEDEREFYQKPEARSLLSALGGMDPKNAAKKVCRLPKIFLLFSKKTVNKSGQLDLPNPKLN